MTELYYTEDGWRNAVNENIHHRERMWNYKGQAIYHITLAVEDRYPLFGKLIGESADTASVWLNEMGHFVDQALLGLPAFYSSKGVDIRILALKVMPDHLHVVIHVRKEMPKSIGEVIRSFKSFCTSHFKREYFQKIFLAGEGAGDGNDGDGRLNNEPEMNKQACDAWAGGGNSLAVGGDGRLNNEPEVNKRACGAWAGGGDSRAGGGPSFDDLFVHFCRIFATGGSIWESMPAGYHERILHCEGQLDRMISYVKDNPRRLWLKRKNPDLFRIRNNQQLCFTDSDGRKTSIRFRALGNIFLLDYPMKQQIQCSRSLTPGEIEEYKQRCELKAIQGYVSVTPAISEGEKRTAQYLREQHYPLIVLLKDGFPKEGSPNEKYFKPGGIYFDACAEGRMLLLEPYEEFLDKESVREAVNIKSPDLPKDTQRYFFLALNHLAFLMAGA